MKKRSLKSTSQIRNQHNLELIRRMRNGDALYSFDSHSSWYPPRPTIEKDDSEVARLYGQKTSSKPAAIKSGSSLVALPRPNDLDEAS